MINYIRIYWRDGTEDHFGFRGDASLSADLATLTLTDAWPTGTGVGPRSQIIVFLGEGLVKTIQWG